MKITYPGHGITVWTAPIPSDPSTTPRERERTAVANLLRQAFGREIILRHHPSGQPYIDLPCSLSVSHCRHMAAIAIGPASAAIGIDIETLRPQLFRVAPRVLSPAELDACHDDLEKLTAAWTLKEAAYKAAGIPGLDFRADIRILSPTSIAIRGKEISVIACSHPIGQARLSLVKAPDPHPAARQDHSPNPPATAPEPQAQ